MLYINNQPIYENFPAFCIDLDKSAVMSWDAVEEIDASETLLNDVVESGRVIVDNVLIAWGKTKPDEHGHYCVLVEQKRVTVETMRALAKAKVI